MTGIKSLEMSTLMHQNYQTVKQRACAKVVYIYYHIHYCILHCSCLRDICTVQYIKVVTTEKVIICASIIDFIFSLHDKVLEKPEHESSAFVQTQLCTTHVRLKIRFFFHQYPLLPITYLSKNLVIQ